MQKMEEQLAALEIALRQALTKAEEDESALRESNASLWDARKNITEQGKMVREMLDELEKGHHAVASQLGYGSWPGEEWRVSGDARDAAKVCGGPGDRGGK